MVELQVLVVVEELVTGAGEQEGAQVVEGDELPVELTAGCRLEEEVQLQGETGRSWRLLPVRRMALAWLGHRACWYRRPPSPWTLFSCSSCRP